jgi:hypothetical protein
MSEAGADGTHKNGRTLIQRDDKPGDKRRHLYDSYSSRLKEDKTNGRLSIQRK